MVLTKYEVKDPTSQLTKHTRGDDEVFYTFATPQHEYLIAFLTFRNDKPDFWRMDFSTKKMGAEPTGEGIGKFVLMKIRKAQMDFLKTHQPSLLKIELVRPQNKSRALKIFGSNLPNPYQVRDGDDFKMQRDHVFSIVRKKHA
jgi:hypothetical protein